MREESVLHPDYYFDLAEFEYADLFDGVLYAWEVLPRIQQYVKAHLAPGCRGQVADTAVVEADVSIGEGTVVEPGAMIKGPTIIGKNVEIRQGAYIRGSVIVGDGAVVGHTTELKNAILMRGVQVPHFNYVGDSVLGPYAHLGAGVKISNVKVTRENIVVKVGDRRYDTGLLKFGVIMGDHTEIGCNAVVNPGTMIGRHSLAYPNISLNGFYPCNSVVKLRQTHEVVPREQRQRTA